MMYVHKLPKHLMPFFWYFVQKQKWPILLMTLCHLAWAIDQTVFTYVFKVFLDRILSFSGDKKQIWSVILGPILLGGAIWLLVSVMFRIFDYVSAFTIPKLEANIRLAMTDYVQYHSYHYFSANFAGSLSNKMSDMTNGIRDILRFLITLYLPTLLAFAISLFIFASLQANFAVITGVWFMFHTAKVLLLKMAPTMNY